MSRDRGAALILVLWLLFLLTGIVGAFALTARVEYLQGRVMVDAAGQQEVARAGLEYALSRLQGDGQTAVWHADGREYRWNFAGQEIALRVVNETGKVDLNAADGPLFEALFKALQVEPSRAQRLAGTVVDWRDADALTPAGGGAEDKHYAAAGLPYGAKDAPFDSVAELQRLLDMDDALYQQLLPLVTVFSGRPRPDPRFSAVSVLTALGLDAASTIAARPRDGAVADVDGAVPAGSGTYAVLSQVRGADGRGVRLHAVVRLGTANNPGAGYTVLRWEQGALSQ
jgi:general secretion pathway protein K